MQKALPNQNVLINFYISGAHTSECQVSPASFSSADIGHSTSRQGRALKQATKVTVKCSRSKSYCVSLTDSWRHYILRPLLLLQLNSEVINALTVMRHPIPGLPD
jgi:hypothetical protein